MIMYGHLWSCMVMHSCICSCLVKYGRVWSGSRIVMYDVWLCMVLYGHKRDCKRVEIFSETKMFSDLNLATYKLPRVACWVAGWLV